MLKRITAQSGRSSQSEGMRRQVAGFAIAVVTLLALAGCGSATSAVGGAHTATGTPGKPGVGKLTVRGCPGPWGTANDAGSPAVVLTNQQKSGNARVGDLIQVQVPATQHWTQIDASPNLALQQPAGVQVSATNVCVWTYRAISAGDASVQLTGGALCEPTRPCPAYAVLADFAITIR